MASISAPYSSFFVTICFTLSAVVRGNISIGSSLKSDVDESPLRQLQKLMVHLCRPTDLKNSVFR
jgi:hypothetical protein